MTPRRLHVAYFAILAILSSSCGQKTAGEPTAMPAAAPAARPVQTAQPQSLPAESPAPKAFVASVPMAQPGPAPAPPTAQDFSAAPALKDVLFGPGRTHIDSSGSQVTRSNARWMIDYPEHLILIEGHSDYKGTLESNLEAGERRAKAAASALVKQGVPGARLWTVSYGSDRPVCAEKTDACAAKNRRVHFRVKKLS